MPWFAAAGWMLLLAVVAAIPGADPVRNTIRVSLFYYAVALNLMLWLRPAEWPVATPRGRLARTCWSLAWLTYLVHLSAAFHYTYAWSHSAAVEHTRTMSGIGEGIYVSHLFTLVWTADVLYWWLRPEDYAGRSPWVDRWLHGFMLFMVFNATVVYEAGPIRWAGAIFFVELAAVTLVKQRFAKA